MSKWVNIFEKSGAQAMIERINAINADTAPQWGKMNAGQVMAHLNVPYELVYENDKPPVKGLKRWLLKTFLKSTVVGEKDYPKNSRTSPDFLIENERNFEVERNRLIAFIDKTQSLGADHFDQKVSNSFGPLTEVEWNAMFAKHLEHHLTQFGV